MHSWYRKSNKMHTDSERLILVTTFQIYLIHDKTKRYKKYILFFAMLSITNSNKKNEDYKKINEDSIALTVVSLLLSYLCARRRLFKWKMSAKRSVGKKHSDNSITHTRIHKKGKIVPNVNRQRLIKELRQTAIFN